MKRKRVILVAIAMLILGGGWYGYKEFTRKVPDLNRVKADIKLNSQDLIATFENNETKANRLYLDKIISIEGAVRSIEKDEQGLFTVILCDESSLSSIRCSMNPEHQQEAAKLKEGAATKIKGACTGFNSNELLGSDVVLNRCVVDKK